MKLYNASRLCRWRTNFGNNSRSLGKIFPIVTGLISRVDSTRLGHVISLALRHVERSPQTRFGEPRCRSQLGGSPPKRKNRLAAENKISPSRTKAFDGGEGD